MRALLLSLALLLAGALAPAHAQKALPGLTEGEQYRYIEDGKPYRATPPGVVEVAEVFAYSCPHCAHFAPMLDAWAKRLPPHARLVLVPGVFGPEDTYARVFFAAEAAKSQPALHEPLFAAIHETGELRRNSTLPQLQAYAARVRGVNVAAFNAALKDDATLLARMREAREFAMRSKIEGTPSLVVGGRYLILGNSYESLLANARRVVDALAPKTAGKPKPAPAKPAAAKPAAKPVGKPAATKS